MRLHFAKVPPYDSIWDDGAVYDSRKCKISGWLINATEQAELIEFLNNLTKGRNNQITLKLGATSSGFFPFGADYGDKGDFIIWIPPIDYKEGKQLYDPLRWWENDLTFCLVPQSALPSYTPATAENEGSLQIGTVAHLLCPQELFDSRHIQALVASVTGDGTVDFVDKSSLIDELETVVPLQMRNGNCAALITFLTGAGERKQTFEITTPNGSFPFGIQHDSTFPFYVNLADGLLEITHINNQRFDMKLKLKFLGINSPGG